MLFCSIVQPSEIPQEKGIGLELRVDRFPTIDLDEIGMLIRKENRPVMLTLRSSNQGGEFQGTEEEKEAAISRLLKLGSPYFDLEYNLNPRFLQKVIKEHPKTKFILSYHDFQKMGDLEVIYDSMKQYQVFSYKIAAMTRSTNEALKMLLFAKTDPNVSAICMGEAGRFARVLGPVVGNLVNYASANGASAAAPGQLSVHELLDTYRYMQLNRETAIYGLIGDPVEKSPGHIHHNAVFQKRNINAVYVKMRVPLDELEEFFHLAKQIGFKGLSVTIPLKEKVFALVDEVEEGAKKIGALNTLLFREGKVLGTNTDGEGALDAIEAQMKVTGKKMVVLGAGGTARAIAWVAIQRGAEVWVLNRTLDRAQALADEFGCRAGSLEDVPKGYDIMVNCSPEMPINPELIRPNTLAMDVVYTPRKTPFLQKALARGCDVVYGEEMFVNQAARQTLFWTRPC